MGTFRILTTEPFDSFDDIVGGTPTDTTSTSFSYTSTAGLAVKVQGTGFTYNAAGTPLTGTVTSMTVWNGIAEYADNSSLRISAASFAKLALGLLAKVGTVLAPDAEALQIKLRSGNDHIYNSDTDRNLFGYGGNDIFHGGSANDWFYGGYGHDSYYGGKGIDGVSFDGQGVIIWASVPMWYEEAELLIHDDGLADSDGVLRSIERIEATDDAKYGDEILLNNWPHQTGMEIWLRGGDDRSIGTAIDSIYGGEGNDAIYQAGLIDGGAGVDTIVVGFKGTLAFWSADEGGHAAVADLSLATSQILDDGFGNIETVKFGYSEVPEDGGRLAGTMFNDTFFGSAGDNIFWGNDGNDSLTGAGGNDELYGNSGRDTLLGGDGNDFLGGGSGKDQMNGGAGIDGLSLWVNPGMGHGATVNLGLRRGQVLDDGYGNREAATGFENLEGSIFGDSLTGDLHSNIIAGEDGDDTLQGAAGNDKLFGGKGSDSLFGGSKADTLWGDAGNDVLYGGAGQDVFQFGDTVAGANGIDRIIDFQVGTDRIALFFHWASDLQYGPVPAGQFLTGAGVSSATNSSQRVIYDTTNGNLYFDSDGNGASASLLIATLDNHAALAADSIFFSNLY